MLLMSCSSPLTRGPMLPTRAELLPLPGPGRLSKHWLWRSSRVRTSAPAVRPSLLLSPDLASPVSPAPPSPRSTCAQLLPRAAPDPCDTHLLHIALPAVDPLLSCDCSDNRPLLLLRKMLGDPADQLPIWVVTDSGRRPVAALLAISTSTMLLMCTRLDADTKAVAALQLLAAGLVARGGASGAQVNGMEPFVEMFAAELAARTHCCPAGHAVTLNSLVVGSVVKQDGTIIKRSFPAGEQSQGAEHAPPG